ncbi:MAG: NAD-dependent epimerase/dehydratase family protein [Alphaproteobacteria bacterium]|nr:NAD-dependent epimerase/dehydratase family protein [Alphaproteobacteria bacterium]
MIAGRKFLITGGTGSFGRTAARRFLDLGAAEVRVLSRDEAKQDVMRRRFSDARLTFMIGDVRDRRNVEEAAAGVDAIFHAAVLKQVPSCEDNPEQAILTNVLGSQNVLDASVSQSVPRVVCLSTDKSVQPVNTMGMTKALMERLVRARARRMGAKGPIFCCVRYGNVLHSRGSVVPLFVEQATAGATLTLTDPRMTRFLIRLEDAVGLVEEALAVGESGDVFVLRSPAATVADIAEAVRRLFRPDAGTRIIGVRPGEKIHEVLVTREELASAEHRNSGFDNVQNLSHFREWWLLLE